MRRRDKMKIPRKKAQGAMEYLMTYAWAILVIIIIGVALWMLGIFGGAGGGTNTARGFNKIKVLDPSIRYAADTTGEALEFTVINGAGQKVSELNITSVDGSCTNSSTTADRVLDSALSAGATDHIFLDGCESKPQGQSFSVEVSFAYSVSVAGRKMTYTDGGTIRGVAE